VRTWRGHNFSSDGALTLVGANATWMCANFARLSRSFFAFTIHRGNNGRLSKYQPCAGGDRIRQSAGTASSSICVMNLLQAPSVTREQFGFRRTNCTCVFCQAPCRHIPGSLDVSDLSRLCPPGQDVFRWAEEHLRALAGRPVPTLVPARRADGSCHWLFQGQCTVHENAPYSCAFFDAHMTEAEIHQRSAATIQAREEDAAGKGLYYRVWLHLCQKGLTAPFGDKAALSAEASEIRRRLSGHPG
jgi:hypothetical protein